MVYTDWNGIQLSKLMLGTVQFGMPYGIANQTGQPDYRNVMRILELAVKGGVNCFDTAAAYGTSEEVLGRALKDLRVSEKVFIATKIRVLSDMERKNRSLAEAAIVSSLDESCQRLQTDQIFMVLFHCEADAVYLDVLNALREKGRMKYFGVSCGSLPGKAITFAADGMTAALQIPGSILDQRHMNSGVFKLASEKSVAIFVRSIYLQGLLVMPEEQIPLHLQDVIPARRALQLVAESAGMSLTEMALRFMLSQPGITSLLTGVETTEQVEENLRMFSMGPLSADVLTAIDLTAVALSERTMTPGLWSK